MGTHSGEITILTFEKLANQYPSTPPPWMDVVAEPPVGLADRVAQMGYQVEPDSAGYGPGTEHFRVLAPHGTDRRSLAGQIAVAYADRLQEERASASGAAPAETPRRRLSLGRILRRLGRSATESAQEDSAQNRTDSDAASMQPKVHIAENSTELLQTLMAAASAALDKYQSSIEERIRRTEADLALFGGLANATRAVSSLRRLGRHYL